MTRDEVIKAAREAGFMLQRDEHLFAEIIERFAAIIIAAKSEDEAYNLCAEHCAKHCAAAILESIKT